MSRNAPDRARGRISNRLALGLLLGLLAASPPPAGARPPEASGDRDGWGRASQGRDPAERRALREQRRAIRREYFDNLPAERRRELRQRVRERRSDRHWLSEAPSEQGRRHRRLHREGSHSSSFDAPRRGGDEERGRRHDGELRERLRQLAPEERRALRRRLRALHELPEAERRRLHERYRELRQRPPEERERLRENSRRWRGMSPELRGELRERMRRLRELPPEERLRLLDDLLGPELSEPPDGEV